MSVYEYFCEKQSKTLTITLLGMTIMLLDGFNYDKINAMRIIKKVKCNK